MIIKVEPKKPKVWICHVCAGEPGGLMWQFGVCSICLSPDRVVTDQATPPAAGLDQQPKIL